MKQMKGKLDHECVSNEIITDNWNILGYVLLRIINTSIRPISTLKICEVIIEKVVKIELEQFIEYQGILSIQQSGFRKKHSCETAVNYVITEWKDVENENRMMAIFLDFKRAFETIEREIMLRKLYMYGIRQIKLE